MVKGFFGNLKKFWRCRKKDPCAWCDLQSTLFS